MSPTNVNQPFNVRPSPTLIATITGGFAYYLGTSGMNCIKQIAIQKIGLFGASFLGYKGPHLELNWTDAIPFKNLFCYTWSTVCDPSFQKHINAMKSHELLNPNLFYKLDQQDINQKLHTLVNSFDPSTTTWFSLQNWANWFMEKYIEANQHKTTSECKNFEILTSAALIGGSALIATKLTPMIFHLYQSYRK